MADSRMCARRSARIAVARSVRPSVLISDFITRPFYHCGAARPFHTALVISLMNPKAILFFVSFFIQFVDPGYAWPALSFAILGLICQIISGVYLSLLILGGAHLAQQFRTRRRLAAGATGGVGVMFIGFGARLADSTLN